jgi:hypothetical protein
MHPKIGEIPLIFKSEEGLEHPAWASVERPFSRTAYNPERFPMSRRRTIQP